MLQKRVGFVLLFVSLVAVHSVTCKWIPPCQKVVKREALQPETEKCDCEAEASNLQPGYILLPLNGEGFDWSLIEKLKQILSNNLTNKTAQKDDNFDYDNVEEYAIGKDLVSFKDEDFVVLEKAEDDECENVSPSTECVTMPNKISSVQPTSTNLTNEEYEPTPAPDGNYVPPIELEIPSIPSLNYTEEEDKKEEPKPVTYPPERFTSENLPSVNYTEEEDPYEEPKIVTFPPEWFTSQEPEEHGKNNTSTTEKYPQIKKNETVECNDETNKNVTNNEDYLKAEIEYYSYKLQLYHNMIEYQQNLINHIMLYLENAIATNNQNSHHHHHPHFEYNEHRAQNDYCEPQASKNIKQAHI